MNRMAALRYIRRSIPFLPEYESLNGCDPGLSQVADMTGGDSSIRLAFEHGQDEAQGAADIDAQK
jgi:hypothetical protein